MADQDEQVRMMMAEQAKKMGSIVAKCWSDEGFKKKLLAEPAATLKANGVTLLETPSSAVLQAVEDTATVMHFVIPAKPNELSEEDLDIVAGGMLCSCNTTATQICSRPPMPMTHVQKRSAIG